MSLESGRCVRALLLVGGLHGKIENIHRIVVHLYSERHPEYVVHKGRTLPGMLQQLEAERIHCYRTRIMRLFITRVQSQHDAGFPTKSTPDITYSLLKVLIFL